MYSNKVVDYGTPQRQSENTVTVHVDGKPVCVPEGTSVMRAATDWKTAHDCVYQHGGRAELVVVLYFPDLLNKTWTPTNKVKTKYNWSFTVEWHCELRHSRFWIDRLRNQSRRS